MQNALISVYYKDNLEPIIRRLHELGVNMYSTGGTEEFILKQGAKCQKVEDLTSYPSILGGRVKTLHPKVFGGILARRDNESDKAQLAEYQIPEFDLVIVDLYPFEETVASGSSETDIIEKIDIGGISLIRAAAKNHKDVCIVASKTDYGYMLDILNQPNGESTLAQRKELAKRAFNVTSHYDTAIFNYFNQENPLEVLKVSEQQTQVLRYGENPHQKGVFFGNLEAMFDKLHGKELSYNNLLDVDAAVTLVDEFTEPCFAILKHNNACGIACAIDVHEAYKQALAADPVSAFGGVLIANRPIDEATANTIDSLFFEVIIAPAFSPEALAIFTKKKNRIILVRKPVAKIDYQFRTLLNGVLYQTKDQVDSYELKPVTDKKVTDSQVKELLFANKVMKHTRSNSIVLSKGTQLFAAGVGQTSRVDSLRQAIAKAQAFGFDLKGAVMASDAFFPFPDCVEIAAEAGITAVIQPGGSIKDQDSIDACNRMGVAMVMTGIRHFKH